MRETEKVLNKKVVNCKIKEYPILNTAIINNAQINHSKNIKLFSRQWTNKTHSLELNIGLLLYYRRDASDISKRFLDYLQRHQ